MKTKLFLLFTSILYLSTQAQTVWVEHLITFDADDPYSVVAFDLNDDGKVDSADGEQWRAEVSAEKMRRFAEPIRPGDTNLDGLVNATDLNKLALNWQIDNATSWCQGDFNLDGHVNASDLNDLALNWNSDVRGAGAPRTASIPEPSTAVLAIFALAAVTCLRRRALST